MFAVVASNAEATTQTNSLLLASHRHITERLPRQLKHHGEKQCLDIKIPHTLR
jgi:hypothetical protein